MRSSVQSLISYKKESTKQMVFEAAHNVMSRLKIGNCKLHNENQGRLCVDVNKNVQSDIKKKLLGRTVTAKGSILQDGERLYFIPKILLGVN